MYFHACAGNAARQAEVQSIVRIRIIKAAGMAAPHSHTEEEGGKRWEELKPITGEEKMDGRGNGKVSQSIPASRRVQNGGLSLWGGARQGDRQTPRRGPSRVLLLGLPANTSKRIV